MGKLDEIAVWITEIEGPDGAFGAHAIHGAQLDLDPFLRQLARGILHPLLDQQAYIGRSR